jgi:hypothetical protein
MLFLARKRLASRQSGHQAEEYTVSSIELVNDPA